MFTPDVVSPPPDSGTPITCSLAATVSFSRANSGFTFDADTACSSPPNSRVTTQAWLVRKPNGSSDSSYSYYAPFNQVSGNMHAESGPAFLGCPYSLCVSYTYKTINLTTIDLPSTEFAYRFTPLCSVTGSHQLQCKKSSQPVSPDYPATPVLG